MSRKLIYIPLWEEEIEELIQVLNNTNYEKYRNLTERFQVLVREVPE